MIAQIPTSSTVAAIPTLPVYIHIVTLRHLGTGDEQTLQIETTSDRFCDVHREICWQRAERGLLGYQIFETLDLNSPF